MIIEERITGATLKAWGYPPGAWYPAAIAAAEEARRDGADMASIHARILDFLPAEPIRLRAAGERGATFNIDPGDNDGERANVAAVKTHMDELMRVPTIVAGAVMPDACPSGSAPGTIPVGGVVASTAIHPGFHSADICCSMAITVFEDADPTAILDAGMMLSHFGGGGRPPGARWSPPAEIIAAFEANAFLADKVAPAVEHYGTQGDGNHFYYVGRLASDGKIALVTHHGSRKPGALLYKAGMAAAQRHRAKLSPETPSHNAWIPADTKEGDDYWAALQIVRAWTKASHFAIHDAVAEHLGLQTRLRFWNEHNFVFRKADGLFYHAKGATPAFDGYAADASGLTLIPLNMAAPILITSGLNAPHGLGFAPHGAGRNFSRTSYMRRISRDGGKHVESTIVADAIREQCQGIDVRFFCGAPDVSELPGAYKDAATIRRQIEGYGLAKVLDTVEPIGCIMAGDWERDAPWRKKRVARERVT